jgi:hypothetical protein
VTFERRLEHLETQVTWVMVRAEYRRLAAEYGVDFDRAWARGIRIVELEREHGPVGARALLAAELGLTADQFDRLGAVAGPTELDQVLAELRAERRKRTPEPQPATGAP